jgi:CzcA family heavy metal efflux pump
MKKIVEFTLKNLIPIIFSLVILAATGIYVFFTLPKDVFPNGEFPRFQVAIDAGYSSLENTQLEITRPVENILKTVPGVVEVRSVTERGIVTIDIYLKWGTDLTQAFQEVQTKINEVQGSLPSGVKITSLRMTTSAYPFSEYGIWSDSMDQKELYTFAKYNILPHIIGLDGIYGVNVLGGEEPEIWIKLNSEKMKAFNIDPVQAGLAIDTANKSDFIGKVVNKKSEYMGFSAKTVDNIKDLNNVVVTTRMGRPVLLSGIADVMDYRQEPRRIASISGHKGVFIDISKQEGSDGIKLSNLVDSEMNSIKKGLKGTLNIEKWDLMDFVRNSIQGIMSDIMLAIILITLITFAVLGKLRYSFPIIIILPAAILLEFIVMKLFGQTVNIMTLGGISAAIGIVADNAIVITENYLKHREKGGRGSHIVDSAADILPPMFSATLVTIVVFMPLAFLSGESGLFFKPLSFTLSTIIILSLVMAVFVTPLLIKIFIEKNGEKTAENSGKKPQGKVKKLYLSGLGAAIKRPRAMLAGIVTLILLSIFAFFRLDTGFLPDWDEGDIVMDYVAPSGNSIYETDNTMTEVEKTIRSFTDVKMYIRKTGTHLGTETAPPNIGEVVILLKDKRKTSTFKIMRDMQKKISEGFPKLDTDFHQILRDRLGDLTGSSKPIVVSVSGNDMDGIRSVADEVKQLLQGVKGLNGVTINTPPMQEEISLDIKQKKASLLGLNDADVSHYATLALNGEIITYLNRGLQLIPVREIYGGDYSENMQLFGAAPIYTPNGGNVPLSRLADYRIVKNDSEIYHRNGALAMDVTAEISGRSLGVVVSDVKKAIDGIKNDSVTISLQGDYKNQQESFGQLIVVLAVSIVLILCALLFIFESYKTSLAVFIGTVSSACIVILGLLITHTEFDVSSFIGLITVMGLVVNNGILVLEFAERFRKKGENILDSVMKAGELRFRPVLITNIAAIAGFLPMALKIGKGGEILYPFSIAMISGLIGSMFFSLVIMPVFYYMLHKSE